MQHRPESPWHTSPGAIDALHRLHRLHVPKCHWRYSDEPMPVAQADNVRHQREALSRHLAWLAIGLIAVVFGGAFL